MNAREATGSNNGDGSSKKGTGSPRLRTGPKLQREAFQINV